MSTLRHSHDYHVQSLNATFVASIPKVGPVDLRDFRPISLIGGVYNIIAKVLAERLKKVISKLVNKHQMAFIKGRQIIDAALIASECVTLGLKGVIQELCMCKLDIEKAYNHVNWDFLIRILELEQMGFGAKWLKQIDFCIKTVRFSIFVNG